MLSVWTLRLAQQLGVAALLATAQDAAGDTPAPNGLLPAHDTSTDRAHICTSFAPIEPDEALEGAPYFDAAIPKRVHQI